MEITPSYDGPPILRFAHDPGDLSVPLLRQRRRLGATLERLDAEQWATQSRCEAWSVRDVVAHLVGTDQFWQLTITAGLAGEPTRLLAGFDPVATPAQMVDATRDQSPAEVLAAYQAGVEALADIVTGLDAAQWQLPAEAPPGHVALHLAAHHAIWDGWTHERDILLSLGMTQDIEDDEVSASLAYAAALGPTFLAVTGSPPAATLAVVGTDPEVRLVIELDDTVTVRRGEAPDDAVVLAGPTVALVEALGMREPFPRPVAEADRWLLGGIPMVFDASTA